MRLTDAWFEASFYGEIYIDRPCVDPDCSVVSPRPHAHSGHRLIPSIDGAQGLFCYCPCGYGTDCAHGLIVPFENPRNAPPVPVEHGPGSVTGSRPRWHLAGASLADLTITPSIDVHGDKDGASCWHGFITNGTVA